MRWPMTHANDNWDKCDICHECDTHDLCHTVTQCDTKNKTKNENKCTNMLLKKWNRCKTFETMWHFDMFVTPKVFKLIGSSSDCRRHCRGTYLSTNKSIFNLQLCYFPLCFSSLLSFYRNRISSASHNLLNACGSGNRVRLSGNKNTSIKLKSSPETVWEREREREREKLGLLAIGWCPFPLFLLFRCCCLRLLPSHSTFRHIRTQREKRERERPPRHIRHIKVRKRTGETLPSLRRTRQIPGPTSTGYTCFRARSNRRRTLHNSTLNKVGHKTVRRKADDSSTGSSSRGQARKKTTATSLLAEKGKETFRGRLGNN
jgi:hypothetical protein